MHLVKDNWDVLHLLPELGLTLDLEVVGVVLLTDVDIGVAFQIRLSGGQGFGQILLSLQESAFWVVERDLLSLDISNGAGRSTVVVAKDFRVLDVEGSVEVVVMRKVISCDSRLFLSILSLTHLSLLFPFR